VLSEIATFSQNATKRSAVIQSGDVPAPADRSQYHEIVMRPENSEHFSDSPPALPHHAHDGSCTGKNRWEGFSYDFRGHQAPGCRQFLYGRPISGSQDSPTRRLFDHMLNFKAQVTAWWYHGRQNQHSPQFWSCRGAAAMNQPAHSSSPQVEQFREYLCLLARIHLPPGRQARVEASDIVQQTLLEAFEQRGAFRGKSDGELAAWLKKLLVHNLADALRANHRAKRDVRRERSLEAAIEDSFSRVDDWLAGSDPSPSQAAVRVEQLLRLAAEVAKLPDDQREAVVLHHLQGWPLAQLAEHLQRSEASVAGLLRRGLKRLRELMEAGSDP
jgi:RNA polymerase sigma-70 factor (ECF subfamily)